MCGITGVISKEGQQIPIALIKRMTDLIAHRGPDDTGYYLGDQLALGHRRLSILDLSAAGHQPMTYKHVKIIFNGEIYNYIEVRKELQKQGYSFHTATDTEVITAAYIHWGENCVNHFNGMWAFCIYDEIKNILFCSRDRYGIKPFHYWENEKRFAFASEIKAILPLIGERKANMNVLLNYLVLGYEDYNEETFFEAIKKLPASHNLIYNLKDHSFKITKYYTPAINDTYRNLDIQDAVQVFRETLIDSVKLRLRSDVKVGACLSGGLDSSTIVAIASGLYNNKDPFNAITAKSIDAVNDETGYAKMVTDHLNIKQHIVTPSFEDFSSMIDDLVYTQEEPFGGLSMLMQYCVFSKAKQVGSTVMLDGQGGDEILLGYSRYYGSLIFSIPWWQRYRTIQTIKKNSSFSLNYIFLSHLYFGYPFIRISRLKNAFKFLKKGYFDYCSFDELRKFSKSLKNIDNMQIEELFSAQLPHLLRYEDRNSMRHSIESRLPFLDYRVVETALSLKNSYKIFDGWSKYPIRKGFDDMLPPSIAWRKNKMGFEPPKSFMIKAHEGNILNNMQNSEIIRKITRFIPNNISYKTRWRLYNIYKWEEIYNVR